MIPDRADLCWLNLSPQAGHEQAGRRPVLILSPQLYNRHSGLAIICPVTNQVKGYPFEVTIPPGLSVTGVILSDHVKSVDWQARNLQFIGKLPEDVIQEVLQKLNTLLGIV